MRKFKHFYYLSTNGEIIKGNFVGGGLDYSRFLEIPPDDEGLTIEQALYMVNRWNMGEQQFSKKGCRYWIELEEL